MALKTTFTPPYRPVDQEAFLNWCTLNGGFDARFDDLCSLIIQYASTQLKDIEFAKSVAQQLWVVVHSCNDITFDSNAQADAYALMHLADRYQRAWQSSMYLFHRRRWPRLREPFNYLDIGTGPGPSLFALSDVYHQAQAFIHGRQWADDQRNPTFQSDYVEQSKWFRHWLHHFTEFANVKTSAHKWQVPYHYGTFNNFQQIQYDKHYLEPAYNRYGDEILVPRVHRYRFSLIILSNFLTLPEHVTQFANEIRDSVRNLKNTGILMCLGAPAKSDKYKALYNALHDLVHQQGYSNWRYQARCREIPSPDSTLSRKSDDPSAVRLTRYFADLIALLKDAKVWRYVPTEARTYLESHAADSGISWEVRIFRKESRMWTEGEIKAHRLRRKMLKRKAPLPPPLPKKH